MRLVTAFVLVMCLGPLGAAAAEDQGPPFGYAAGFADAQTGLIGAAMARTGSKPQPAVPGVHAGQIGLVGVHRDAPAGRLHAWASVDVGQLATIDPDAALCIQISAPASESGPALPNNVEGGGPVCQFLGASGGTAHRLATNVSIETFAESATPRTVGAEVFVSWRQPHPRETGATVSAARVLTIGFAPVAD